MLKSFAYLEQKEMCLLRCVIFNVFRISVVFRIETGHLICFAYQITSFYMKCKARLKWVGLNHHMKLMTRTIKNELQSHETHH